MKNHKKTKSHLNQLVERALPPMSSNYYINQIPYMLLDNFKQQMILTRYKVKNFPFELDKELQSFNDFVIYIISN